MYFCLILGVLGFIKVLLFYYYNLMVNFCYYKVEWLIIFSRKEINCCIYIYWEMESNWINIIVIICKLKNIFCIFLGYFFLSVLFDFKKGDYDICKYI